MKGGSRTNNKNDREKKNTFQRVPNQEGKPPVNNSAKKAMPAVPLSNEDLKRFLLDGYLIIKPTELSLDAQWHTDLFHYATHVLDKEGNPGNNILPRIPQLNQVFNDSRVKAILTRLLGRNYAMQAHRFPHFTRKGQRDQQWHKDSFFGFQRPLRHNQIRNVMLMYYPQKTTIAMGPTALRRGTQYVSIDPKRYKGELPNEFSDKWREETDRFMECEAGSILLIHYDLIHRGSRNDSDERHMFKFQFNRVIEPAVDNTVPQSVPNYEDVRLMGDFEYDHFLDAPAKAIWNWINNIPYRIEKVDPKKLQGMESKSELERFSAAYSAGVSGDYSTLMKRIHCENDQFCYNAAHGLVACRSSEAVKALISQMKATAKATDTKNGNIASTFVISEWGPLIKNTLDDKDLLNFLTFLASWRASKLDRDVRLYIAEALGTVFCEAESGEATTAAVNQLITLLSDNNEQIRFTAALSLARIGSAASIAILHLKETLYSDSNRYVIANTLTALERIRSVEAMDILLEYLKVSRWCYITTPTSSF